MTNCPTCSNPAVSLCNCINVTSKCKLDHQWIVHSDCGTVFPLDLTINTHSSSFKIPTHNCSLEKEKNYKRIKIQQEIEDKFYRC